MINKAKSIQDKSWKSEMKSWLSLSKVLVDHDQRIRKLEQSNPNSPEEQCWCHCHYCATGIQAHYKFEHMPYCQPKTEDIGEFYGDSITSDDYIKEQRIRNARYNKHLDEVKTQQGWEERFDELIKDWFNFSETTQLKLKKFISQEIESSNRRLIEKIKSKIESMAIITVDDSPDLIRRDRVLEELKEAGDE